jgi:hypothetical protein
MIVEIANVKTLKMRPGKTYVYCGRGRAPEGMENAGLGNPFPLKPGESRGATIERYTAYLDEALKHPTRELWKLNELVARIQRGEKLVLVCWCSPLACHTNVIADRIERIARSVAG